MAVHSQLLECSASEVHSMVEGETRLVPGHFRLSARLLPVRRGGVLVSRVVTLLFDASSTGTGSAITGAFASPDKHGPVI